VATAAEPEVAPERLADLLSAGEVELVDVRTPSEYEAGHIAGARHIPFGELSTRAHEIDPTRPVVLYCRSGGRSAAATQAFQASGWEAQTLSGGIVEWVQRGLPLEPEGGEVTRPSGLPD